jgi:hypothetical protein
LGRGATLPTDPPASARAGAGLGRIIAAGLSGNGMRVPTVPYDRLALKHELG